MANCCICQKHIEREDAPVLTMGSSGNPRLLCDECDALLESATTGKEISEIKYKSNKANIFFITIIIT